MYADGRRTVSLLVRSERTEEHVIGIYEMGDRVKPRGKLGAFCGAVSGWVLGLAALFVPGIGMLVIGGPLVALLVTVLEGAVAVDG